VSCLSTACIIRHNFALQVATCFFPLHALVFHRKIEFSHYKLRVSPFHCMNLASFALQAASYFSHHTHCFSTAKSSFPLRVACLAFSLHEFGNFCTASCELFFPTTRTGFLPQKLSFFTTSCVFCLFTCMHHAQFLTASCELYFSHHTRCFSTAKSSFPTTSCVSRLFTA
jgi:hypothetical protein